MRLQDLSGAYDSIFSLGQNCLPALQMQRLGLRKVSGPLDWMISDQLKDINQLLSTGFANFMELPNLTFVNYNVPSPQNLYVKDGLTNIISAHDFPMVSNSPGNLVSYPEVKVKLNRRVDRFKRVLVTSNNILFIRMQGTMEEARELENILSRMVSNHFKVLLVKPMKVEKLMDLQWPFQKICAVAVPEEKIWRGGNSDDLWDVMLRGVTLNQ